MLHRALTIVSNPCVTPSIPKNCSSDNKPRSMGNESSKFEKKKSFSEFCSTFTDAEEAILKATLHSNGNLIMHGILSNFPLSKVNRSNLILKAMADVMARELSSIRTAHSNRHLSSQKESEMNEQFYLIIWKKLAHQWCKSPLTGDKSNFIIAFTEVYHQKVKVNNNIDLFKMFIHSLAQFMASFRQSSKYHSIPNEYPSNSFVDFILTQFNIPATSFVTDDLSFLDITESSCQLNDYHDKKMKEIVDKLPTFSSFQDWFPRNVYLMRLWNQVFNTVFFGTSPTDKPLSSTPNSKNLIDRLPILVGPKSEVLSLEDIFVLDTCLEESSRAKDGRWHCLFSSKTNGNSWTNFQSAIECAGSLIIVVNDKRGNVFGAFSAQELVPNSSFSGTSQNFLFSLCPQKRIYRSQGLNDHFQYFNYRTSAFPNGLGFGGQFDYFGLWIDESFETGHSKGSPVSSTYGNPPLSGNEEFTIDHVEVWCVNKRYIDEGRIDPKQSALENNPEALELLEMAGKKIWSKDVQQTKVTDSDED